MTKTVRPDRRRPVERTGAAARQRTRRPTRRRVMMRRWTVLLVFLSIVGLVYILLFTSVMGVRSVDVEGIKGLTADEVRSVAAVEMGKPLIRLDTTEIAKRVATLPRVGEVDVRRSWPSTVEIVISERTPVAIARRPDGVHLIDEAGVDYAVNPQPPAGLPALDLATIGPDDPSTRATVEVLAKIPQQLRNQVVTLSAKTPGSVQLALGDGRTVRWGNAQNSERKAMVLAALLTRPGKVYDVSAPDLPTVSS